MQVVCVDNFLTSTFEHVDHLIGHPCFQLIRADVTEPLAVDGNVDLLFHFASPASPVDYLRFPVETLMVGALGTKHLLDIARQKGSRFVLASTSEAYGDPEVHPQPEGYWGNVNPVGPRSVYDEAKRFAEALTAAYRRCHGVTTSIARIFNTAGPRMRPHDGRAVPTFIRQALRNEPLTVAGDGRQTRSIQYVDDLVEGIVRLARSGHPGPMNIGNPTELSMLDLATLVRDLSGSSSPIRFVERPEDDPRTRRPDISLARQVLDWEPEVGLEQGLRRTIEWFAARDQLLAT
jgi:dTDP-glucose 4,6-dehydratase